MIGRPERTGGGEPSESAPRVGSDFPSTTMTTRMTTKGRPSLIPTRGTHVYFDCKSVITDCAPPIRNAVSTVGMNNVGADPRRAPRRAPGR